jgi:hypothetical protein
MPKFIYTVILLTLVSWGIWIHRLIKTSPDSTCSILIFLFFLFCSLALTFSIPIYMLFYRKAPTLTNLRPLYRRALKWSVFFSSGIILLLTLKAFDVLSIFNAGLLLALYTAVFMHFKKKNR